MWHYRTRVTKRDASVSPKNPSRDTRGSSKGTEGRDDEETLRGNVGLERGDGLKFSPHQGPIRSLLKLFLPLALLSLVAIVLSLTQTHSSDVVLSWMSDAPNFAKRRFDQADPKAFSACLVIKDESIILPEWLAYHYTRLPLRRLFVAVDPLSATDPTPILRQYEKIGMNITIWYNESDYMKGKNGFGTLHNQHRGRQRAFYTSCLRKLQEEGKRWTILIDTDEFLSFNNDDDKKRGEPVHCRENSTCTQQFDQSSKEVTTHLRTRLGQFKTAADIIGSQNVTLLLDSAEKPCVILVRFLYPSKDSEPEGLPQLPPGFNASNFHTVRFRHRSKGQNPKVILDVSRLTDFTVKGPHRINNNCTTLAEKDFIFRVNHYGW